jgi:putative ABC transport system substrate-binding protein
MPIVGLLGSATARQWAPFLAQFIQGLSDTGFVEGQNVAIDYRWAEGQFNRLPALAAELVDRQVSVLAALTTPAAVAAKAATSKIPIVFVSVGNPVELGLIANLSHPGGNVTGATYLNVEIGPKLLELLREVMPTATTAAALNNPINPNAETVSRNLYEAAHKVGLEVHVLNVSNDADIDAAFVEVVRLRPSGRVMVSDAFINTRGEEIAALALRHRVPAFFQTRAFVIAGGLMSYGGRAFDAYRQAGVYTGRVLKGEKPADLPVQQSTKIELIINLKTAKALGLTIPIPLQGRADEFIE